MVVDATDPGQRQGALAATEPSFEFTLEGRAIHLNWQNLETVTINYYLMDVELLFSRNPFVQRSGGQFASIKPNLTREVKLPAGQAKLSIPLPEELIRRNVLVEVTAAGKTRSGAYYANAMDVKFTENYGQVRVQDEAAGKPLSKVYVKVYARLADGSVKFHKDGYTDLRGRFDYVSVNTPERLAIEQFAVLVLSEERGALIRDVAPPQRWKSTSNVARHSELLKKCSRKGVKTQRDTNPRHFLGFFASWRLCASWFCFLHRLSAS